MLCAVHSAEIFPEFLAAGMIPVVGTFFDQIFSKFHMTGTATGQPQRKRTWTGDEIRFA